MADDLSPFSVSEILGEIFNRTEACLFFGLPEGEDYSATYVSYKDDGVDTVLGLPLFFQMTKLSGTRRLEEPEYSSDEEELTDPEDLSYVKFETLILEVLNRFETAGIAYTRTPQEGDFLNHEPTMVSKGDLGILLGLSVIAQHEVLETHEESSLSKFEMLPEDSSAVPDDYDLAVFSWRNEAGHYYWEGNRNHNKVTAMGLTASAAATIFNELGKHSPDSTLGSY